MTITTEIRESLNREYKICSRTISYYKKQIRRLEKKYKMSTTSFLNKFAKGKIGDEQEFFDWYAFHKLLFSWENTKKAIHPLIK